MANDTPNKRQNKTQKQTALIAKKTKNISIF